MAITTIRTIPQRDGISISLVEITEEGAGVHRSWELVCEDCETFLSGLTEFEATHEADVHVCSNAEAPPKVVDLMAALEDSVTKAKAARKRHQSNASG